VTPAIHRLVVRRRRLAELVAHILQVSDHDAHALVEFLAEAADLLGVLGELLLLPAVIGRAQERIERGRRGHHDLLGHAVLDQPAVGVRRGAANDSPEMNMTTKSADLANSSW